MTSPSQQKERAKMPGPVSNGRLTNFNAMTNGADTSEQRRSSAFPAANGTKQTFVPSILPNTGIWSVRGGWDPRPAIGTSRDPTDNLPTGSGTLTASSEAEPPYQSSWPAQTRNPPGNTSPNRSRIEAPSHELNLNNSAFYQHTPSQTAIGHRGPAKASPGQALDGLNGIGQLQKPSEVGMPYPVGIDGGDHKRTYFGMRNQVPQSSQYPQIPSRLQQGSHSETTPHQITHPYTEAHYGAYPSHSQRPSISGQSSSLGQSLRGIGSASGRHMEEMELPDLMNDMMLDSTTGGSNGISNLHGFQSSHSQFQFNPGSQPWDNVTPLGSGGFDTYGTGRRESGVDRSSPASAYPSQRSFAGTPQPTTDYWGSRPASRDHRTPLESDTRSLMQPYLHQNQPTQYAPSPYINQNFPQYGPIYDNFQSVSGQRLGGYPPFAQSSGFRPGREADTSAANSPLMQDFRAHAKSGRLEKDKRWELRDIFGHIVEFSGDQHGSRFIQGKLESANSDEKSTVFDEICPNAVVLMKDVFGNYVIQKLLEHGSQVQKKILADKMRGQVVALSKQMYACRVVQKALEHILVEQQAELVRELEPDIMSVMMDQNGNHVVQKVVELVPREYIGFIMDSFKGRVGQLSEHTYACRVIQRALEHGTEEDKKMILSEIHEHTPSMVMNQYGNYVSQHVIERGKPEDRSLVIVHVTSQLLTLSKHKFASNVVEKCIEHGTAEERKRIAEQLTGRPDGDDSHLQAMMKDQYGNYVVQKLLKTLKGSELTALKDALKPQILALKKPGVNAGKHINLLENLVIDQATVPSSPTPISPGLQGNGGSTVPTPNLTTEPNSPSSNLPSTNASSVGEVEHQTNGKLIAGEELNGSVTLQVRDDGC